MGSYSRHSQLTDCWEELGEGCTALDVAAVLRAGPRSFVLRVRGQAMVGAGICDGDLVVGEFTPEARPGAVVVALIDGESVLRRVRNRCGKICLVSDNPYSRDSIPLAEVVIQGVAHTVIRRIAFSDQQSAFS